MTGKAQKRRDAEGEEGEACRNAPVAAPRKRARAQEVTLVPKSYQVFPCFARSPLGLSHKKVTAAWSREH